MQMSELSEIIGALLFGGDVLVAGLMLTGFIVLILMSLVSMARPPAIAYAFIVILGVLMSMGLGFIDYYLVVLILLVCAASLAWKISETMRD